MKPQATLEPPLMAIMRGGGSSNPRNRTGGNFVFALSSRTFKPTRPSLHSEAPSGP
jgi:hypothetical protein